MWRPSPETSGFMMMLVPTFDPPPDGPHLDRPHPPQDSFRSLCGPTRLGTRCPLFRLLPEALLPEITAYLPRRDLVPLLRVDRAFCQLARSVLFHTVVLDYSLACLDLLRILAESHALHARSPAAVPDLARCVRVAQLRTAAACLQARHGITVDAESEADPDAWRRRVHGAAWAFYREYLPVITATVAALCPGLRDFRFLDPIHLPAHLVNAVLALPGLRGLVLDGGVLPDAVRFPETLRLTTLTIAVGPNLPDCTPNPVVAALPLLQRCCATLRDLRLKACLSKPDAFEAVDWAGFAFPRLTALTVARAALSAASLSALLGRHSAVTDLTLRHCGRAACAWIAERCDPRSLRRLVFADCRTPAAALHPMLRGTARLEALVLDSALPPAAARSLCSLLRAHSPRLRSLKLTLKTPPDESVLQGIAALGGLRRLWLVGGEADGLVPGPAWEVQHPALRAALAPLEHLSWLALEHDTYPPLCRAAPGPRPEYYLSRDEGWDRRHLCGMRAEADRYPRAFPGLRLLYVGRLLFRFAPAGPRGRRAVPQGARIDDCRDVLHADWGLAD